MSTKITLKDNGSDNAEISFLVGSEYSTVSSYDFQDDAYSAAERLCGLISEHIKREDLLNFMAIKTSGDGRSFTLKAGNENGVIGDTLVVDDIGDLCDPYDAAEVLLCIYNIMDN